MKALLLTLAMCLIVLPVHAKYSGGTGEPNDPYQIATAADLILLGESPGDYGKHFIVMADIDLDPRLPGRKVFDRAVIAPGVNDVGSWFQGTPFTGVFDGTGHTISHLTIKGKDFLGLFGNLAYYGAAEVKGLAVVGVNITGAGSFIGGLVGYNGGRVAQCHSMGVVSGGNTVGGLVGRSEGGGTVTHCSSTCAVRGGFEVGGLVGCNWDGGNVTQCYSSGTVCGDRTVGSLLGHNGGWCEVANCYSTAEVNGNEYVGGLVGRNDSDSSIITHCHSTGTVSGTSNVGGLVGGGWPDNEYGGLTDCFWDIQTSGQATSDGGTRKSTAEMQTASTFLSAGWDFVGETKNGTEDIWWINEGADCPRLVWERWAVALAFSPSPGDGVYDVLQSPILIWCAWRKAAAHDVYFGEDREAVANATPEAMGVYRGRQAFAVTGYDPGMLESQKTYYWRIDEVNEADLNSPWKGNVWSFTTRDYIVLSVVDDFESYADDRGHFIFKTWIDRGGSSVGNFFPPENPPYAEQRIVHSGNQSMPMEYYNDAEPWYSEAERTWETLQDWRIDGTDTLTLYFQGQADNSRERLYVAIEDSVGRIAVVPHPDPNAMLATQWQKWHIPLVDLRTAGVDVGAVKKMAIGVGDRSNPKPGGTGKIYIDDIRLTKRMP